MHSIGQAPNTGVGKALSPQEPEFTVDLTEIDATESGRRFVCMFFNVLTEEEHETKRKPFDTGYDFAVMKAKLLGGKGYTTKKFGGGIAFYGRKEDVTKTIQRLASTPYEELREQVKVKKAPKPKTYKQMVAVAKSMVKSGHQDAIDLCDNLGQMYDNVSQTTWFLNEMIYELVTNHVRYPEYAHLEEEWAKEQ